MGSRPGRARADPAGVEPEAGQLWRYRTRPGEEESRVRVLLVERDERFGMIVHVRVEGVQIPNPIVPERPNRVLGHAPVDLAAFRQSVTELQDTTSGAPDLEGYREWRDAGGGVFTLTVAEVVQSIADTLAGAPATESDP